MANYPAVQELDSILHSLLTLKPPGVNKAKVDAASKLCMDPSNATIEAAFVDSFINAFRNSPVSHKLGVLYIVDSVTRQWNAAGTIHAGGIRKMTEALPYIVNDYIPVIPDGQKDKVLKLLEIWISSRTFPPEMLHEFRTRILNPSQPLPSQQQPKYQPQMPQQSQHHQQQMPQQMQQQQQLHHHQAPPQQQSLPNSNTDAAALFALLANPPPPPQQQQVAPPPPPQPQQSQQPDVANLLAAFLSQQQQQQQQVVPPTPQLQAPPPQPQNPFPFQTNNAPVNFPPVAQAPPPPPPPPPPVPQMPGQFGASFPAPQSNPLAALMPMSNSDPNAATNQLMQQLAQNPDLVKTLFASMGIPMPPMPNNPQPQQALYPVNRDNRDSRNRSRSPPNRRESPSYGAYNQNSADHDQNDRGRRGKRGDRDYRQRSPPPASHDENSNLAPPGNKIVGFDSSLRDNKIRVLSRTLFVGGVKTSEAELKAFFANYGGVQSCIVNHDKRHAFLKLVTHEDANNVRQIVSYLPDKNYRPYFERVNWAVGFGPTDCADYAKGESVIPIDLLTDADRKWMQTAEYGGTGGRPLAQGMVVEEPDIEIGAGPSSKAIHRRGGKGSGRGGNFGGRRSGGGGHHHNNNQNNHGGGGHQNHEKGRKQDRPEHFEAPAIAAPPAVPTFGAPIPGFPNFR